MTGVAPSALSISYGWASRLETVAGVLPTSGSLPFRRCVFRFFSMDAPGHLIDNGNGRNGGEAMTTSERVTIPARKGRACRLLKGQAIKIINTHGHQVVDTWAFNAD